MDKIDQKIIQELNKNGRKPFRTIAKRIGISTQTITRRYNKMKKNGTIARLIITLNPEKLGYIGTAYLFIKVNHASKISQVIEQLSKTPNLIRAVPTFGSYEIYAILAFRNMIRLNEDILKINELPNILNLDFSVAVPGIKRFP